MLDSSVSVHAYPHVGHGASASDKGSSIFPYSPCILINKISFTLPTNTLKDDSFGTISSIGSSGVQINVGIYSPTNIPISAAFGQYGSDEVMSMATSTDYITLWHATWTDLYFFAESPHEDINITEGHGTCNCSVRLIE